MYKKHKIAYRKPKYWFIAKMKKGDRIKHQQKIFVEDLVPKIMEGELVIFSDETTFNLWQRPTKLLLRRDENYLFMQSFRGKSITMIGATDSKAGSRCVHIFEGSNTSAKFIEVLDILKRRLVELKLL